MCCVDESLHDRVPSFPLFSWSLDSNQTNWVSVQLNLGRNGFRTQQWLKDVTSCNLKDVISFSSHLWLESDFFSRHDALRAEHKNKSLKTHFYPWVKKRSYRRTNIIISALSFMTPSHNMIIFFSRHRFRHLICSIQSLFMHYSCTSHNNT